LADGAAFCRSCGKRYEPPAEARTAHRPTDATVQRPAKARHSRLAPIASVAIVLLGAGVAAAILLTDQGSSSTTVVVEGSSTTGSERLSATGSVEAGRYIQAGSFKTLPHAEEERERLGALGIGVDVVSSDSAQELYPGFQMLLAGPYGSAAQARPLLRALHENGAPTAFVRDLTPALQSGGPGAITGTWSGTLERQSGDRPNLNDSLPATLTIEPGGDYGDLEFPSLGCTTGLTLSTETSSVLGYSQDPPCVGDGLWRVRVGEEGPMLSLLPSADDVIVLGTLAG